MSTLCNSNVYTSAIYVLYSTLAIGIVVVVLSNIPGLIQLYVFGNHNQSVYMAI